MLCLRGFRLTQLANLSVFVLLCLFSCHVGVADNRLNKKKTQKDSGRRWNTAGASSSSSSNAGSLEYSYWRLLQLREATRDMFMHSYDSYMTHAFPYDELCPVRCQPRRWDKRERGTLDDNLGGFALTLVDAADTLALMGEKEAFQEALQLIKHNVTFNNSVVVSVFETTIRVLGGLLSAHLLASDPTLNLVPDYDGFLIDRAHKVGESLLPAFNTKTKIPYHRVHLLHGVPKGETEQTCLAAAGTLTLEFGMLSRLTGDKRFEKAAQQTVDELWKRRSKLDLLGNTINVRSGKWSQPTAGTGPGRDSFYE